MSNLAASQRWSSHRVACSWSQCALEACWCSVQSLRSSQKRWLGATCSFGCFLLVLHCCSGECLTLWHFDTCDTCQSITDQRHLQITVRQDRTHLFVVLKQVTSTCQVHWSWCWVWCWSDLVGWVCHLGCDDGTSTCFIRVPEWRWATVLILLVPLPHWHHFARVQRHHYGIRHHHLSTCEQASIDTLQRSEIHWLGCKFARAMFGMSSDS